GLARAIAPQSSAVLFDEPTTGLDPPNTRRINDLIRSTRDHLKATAIVVTHDLPSAYMISDRIAMLSDHKILTILPTADFRRASEPKIREFIDAMDATDLRPEEGA